MFNEIEKCKKSQRNFTTRASFVNYSKYLSVLILPISPSLLKRFKKILSFNVLRFLNVLLALFGIFVGLFYGVNTHSPTVFVFLVVIALTVFARKVTKFNFTLSIFLFTVNCVTNAINKI
jgi:hypothetical protein